MQSKYILRCPVACLIVLAASLFVGMSWAQTETTVYRFKGNPDGGNPYAGLIADSKGNGYGTTYTGGGSANCSGGLGCGTVYKITSTGKESVIHAFTGGTTDGCFPRGPLVIDKSGNLYGTTSGCGLNATGTVFKVSASGQESIVHHFGVEFLSGDGAFPWGGLAMDVQGNLYGTTTAGGVIPNLAGTIFKITPSGAEIVLYSFSGGADGGEPIAGPTLDASGNIYGTTDNGGDNNDGVVFELSTSGTLIVLHSFGASGDGVHPYAGVIFDKRGNLYGTTSLGGANGAGTVYAVNPKAKAEKILHDFDVTNGDGVEPYAGVVLDKAQANLYGTTPVGGAFAFGVVYRLALSTLKETILYNFGGPDGSTPFGDVVLDPKGNIYGTTSVGGKNNFGTVFRVVP